MDIVSSLKSALAAQWGWVVTGASCVIFFFIIGFMLTFTILFVALQEEFNSSATETAWVGSIPFGFSCVTSPIVNVLIAKIGHRMVTAIGVTITAIGLLVTSFMTSIAPVYFTYSIAYGFGSGCMMFGSFGLLLAYFPLKNSTRAIVLPMAASNLGMLSLGPLTFFLQNVYGWRNLLRVMATIIFTVTVPVCLLTYHEPTTIVTSTEDKYSDEDNTTNSRCEDITTINVNTKYTALPVIDEVTKVVQEGTSWEGGVTGGSGVGGEHGAKRGRGLGFRMLAALTYPDVWLLSIAVFGYGLVNSFVIVQLVNFMLSVGFTEANGALAVTVVGVSLMCGKIVLVLFADVIPFPKLFLFIIASVTGVSVLICLLLVNNLAVWLTVTAVQGAFVMSIADSLPYSVCNHVFGVAKGTESMAIVSVFHGIGFMCASLLGESIDRTGSYDTALYACVGTYTLCGICCIMIPIYQHCCVRDRYTMEVSFGWRKPAQINDYTKKSGPPHETNFMVTDYVTSL